MSDKGKIGWLARLVGPENDFYSMLTEQAKITLDGVEALELWINEGALERCQTVRDLEHKADVHKLRLEKMLVETLITPIDREDIYDLSHRLDEVINCAKRTVREMEALEVRAEGTALPKMATTLAEGARCLLISFSNLASDLSEAASQASLARKSDNKLEKIYRKAMLELFQLDDIKRIMKTAEVYRTMTTAGQRIDVVGEKLSHVIVKLR
jgi:uncharacterized protein Yka (UPF0111/DUF47 family)